MSEGPGIRMGELLIQQGVMTREQVDEVLARQQKSARPFGFLAEMIYGIAPEDIERAWINQYLSYDTSVNLEDQKIDIDALKTINRRQAWQFGILPLRQEASELVMATSGDGLPKAVNFAWRRLPDPVYFLIAERPQLEAFIREHYPWPAAEQAFARAAG